MISIVMHLHPKNHVTRYAIIKRQLEIVAVDLGTTGDLRRLMWFRQELCEEFEGK